MSASPLSFLGSQCTPSLSIILPHYRIILENGTLFLAEILSLLSRQIRKMFLVSQATGILSEYAV